MKKTEFIDTFADLHDEEINRIDGFDGACIGWTDSWNGNERPVRLVYDANKMLEILEQEGMSEDDALDYFHHNIAGAYVGKSTPVIINNWHDTLRDV